MTHTPTESGSARRGLLADPPTWLHHLAVGLAVLRIALPVTALLFVGVLVPDHMLLLILVRPGKEFLLLGGGLLRTTGAPSFLGMLAAYIPLMIVATWAFFLLGRVHGDRLRDGTAAPWLTRMVPADRLEAAARVLTKRGPVIAVIGRLAAFPPTVLAAAAGASDVSARRYLGADLVGALASFSLTVGIGVALGDAYERGGVWITVGGVALFLVATTVVTRWIQREADRPYPELT